MHKILKQTGKKPVGIKSKKIRISTKAFLLSTRLGKELNNTKRIEEI